MRLHLLRRSAWSAILLLVACAPEPAVAPPSVPASPAASSAPSAPAVPDAIRQVVAEPDRTAEDRALDASRRPAELLAFAGVHAGARVGEVGSWHAYTAELLSRAVGPTGHIYAEDPADLEKWIHAAWTARTARRDFTERVTHLLRPFEDPFGPDVRGLDAVLSVMFYHDTVWLGVDRAKMNVAIHDALAPGGSYVVVDHSARPGEGSGVTKTLHRIEEGVVVDEIQRAGFVLAGHADFLRHPEDTRDWNAGDEGPADRRGTSDRFVLRFTRR